ncbi:unnamed protein product [Caenorhabditis brenneri]
MAQSPDLNLTVLPCYRNEHVVAFCAAKQIPILGVRRYNGVYFFYFFNEESCHLEVLECLECQPIATEKDLVPVNGEWCEELNDYIIYMTNHITLTTQQYIFNHTTCGFVQVNIPGHTFTVSRRDGNNMLPIEIVKYPKTEDHDEILIHRHPLTNTVMKQRYSEKHGKHLPIVAIPVKTMMIARLEQQEKPRKVKGAAHYIGGVCPHQRSRNAEGVSYIGVFLKGRPCWFFYDFELGFFVDFQCDFCPGPTSENRLQIFYSIAHKGQIVLFAFNEISLQYEQYVYNPETTGLEQVDYPELEYNKNFVHNPVLQVVKNEKGEMTTLLSAQNYRFLKSRLVEKEGRFVQLPMVPVKVLKPTSFANNGRNQRMSLQPRPIHPTTSSRGPKDIYIPQDGFLDYLTSNFQTMLVQDTEQQQPCTSSSREEKPPEEAAKPQPANTNGWNRRGRSRRKGR